MVPVILGGLGLTGVLGYLYWHHDHGRLPENVKPPPPPPILANPAKNLPHTIDATPNAPMAPPIVNVLKTSTGKPLVILTPKAPDGSPTTASTLATSGPAASVAHDLYDALVSKSYAGATPALVSAFQQAVNADPESKQLHGAISVTGKYDLPTSAALTIYTGLPIPPDPKAPPMATMTAATARKNPKAVDFTIPGPGSLAGSNLWAYLKMHGNVNKSGRAFQKKDPVLFELVREFQHGANVDPKFPGVSYAYPKLAVIKSVLKEDGQYGKGTSDALAAIALERIPS